jgi:hypothetical protein
MQYNIWLFYYCSIPCSIPFPSFQLLRKDSMKSGAKAEGIGKATVGKPIFCKRLFENHLKDTAAPRM